MASFLKHEDYYRPAPILRLAVPVTFDGVGDDLAERAAAAIDAMATEGQIPDTDRAIDEAAVAAAEGMSVEDEWTGEALGRVPRLRRLYQHEPRVLLARKIGEAAKRRRSKRKSARPAAPLSGLGDWKGDIALAIAGKDLDKLVSAIMSVQDKMVEAINARPVALDGYRKAKALYDDATRRWGPPSFSVPMPYTGSINVPNPRVASALYALNGARQSVEVFARMAQTLSLLDRVFTNISAELTRAGLAQEANNVDMTTRQVKRFLYDSDNAFAAVPEFMAAKGRIMNVAYAEWQAWGVDGGAIGDPRWLQAYLKAADKVVRVPGAEAPPAGGVAGMGDPLGPLAFVLISVIGGIVATVVAIHGINKLVGAWNSKAETARVLILQRDREKEEMRKAMAAAGRPQAEIDAAVKAFDENTKQQVKDIPEGRDPFGSIALVLGIGVAAMIGAKAAGVM